MGVNGFWHLVRTQYSLKGNMVFKFLRSTRWKVLIAHAIFKTIRLLRIKQKRVVCRKGLIYEIDLAEGIDLSIFLFGGFQKHITQSKLFEVPQNAVIFDIGANCGAISLSFADLYLDSIVYAFEPTDYAFQRLIRNIELNKNRVEDRILPIQTFISESSDESTKLEAYSSWPIDKVFENKKRHPVHLGLMKGATNQQTSLDAFVQRQGIKKIDIIKIDTDGHELSVLKGGLDTIRKFRPTIIFEVTTYLLDEQNQSFLEFENLLLPLEYKLLDAQSHQTVTDNRFRNMVPEGGGIDIVALPKRT